MIGEGLEAGGGGVAPRNYVDKEEADTLVAQDGANLRVFNAARAGGRLFLIEGVFFTGGVAVIASWM